MSTPLTDAINVLTTYVNGITGKSDTNLPDAVRSLTDGYGGGSLPSVISAIDGGEFTVSADTAAYTYSISHNLGVVPRAIVVWTEDALAETANSKRYMQSCYFCQSDLTSGSNTYKGTGSTFVQNTNGGSAHLNTDLTANNIQTYLTANTFKSTSNGAVYYKTGITYKWMAFA